MTHHSKPFARSIVRFVAGAGLAALLVATASATAWASPPRPIRPGNLHREVPRASAHRAAPSANEVRSPDLVSYTVDLTSDVNGFTWTGTESVTFTNVASEPMARVWIRLWDNGIEGCTHPLPIRMAHLSGGTPGPLAVDCSALPVDLPAPLGQGDQATISFDLAIAVPNVNWRFGRIGSMALVGNALPLLAIRDSGGWHLDPYTSNGESFYSQDGDFTVTFHTPPGLKVPATGQIQTVRATPSGGPSGVTVDTTYVANGVRDFAWASGPLQELEGVASTGVTIKVWWPDSISLQQAQDALDISKQAMPVHAARFGDYPYPEVDVILGLFTAFGGMEYPQLVMSDPSDSVIVHELGHQWWFGIVGDDQYTEPWLDEAFASYATDVFYGDHQEDCASAPWPSPDARVSNSMAYFDQHPNEYYVTVYFKGACALHDLGRVLGPRVVVTFLRTYARKLALDFSTTAKFQNVAQRVADHLPNPIDLTQFWKDHRIGEP